MPGSLRAPIVFTGPPAMDCRKESGDIQPMPACPDAPHPLACGDGAEQRAVHVEEEGAESAIGKGKCRHYARNLSILWIPQRLVLLHRRGKTLAEDLDLDLCAGHGQIGAQHAERDRFVHTMAPAS